MIQLIFGDKGSGKTKTMIEMINESAKSNEGSIVCIEKSMKLTFNIDHSVRLIDVDDYMIRGYEHFYGFFSGILAGNYDISEVYVDGILKIGGGVEGLGCLLDKINAITENNIKVVITVSTDEKNAPEDIKKYM